MSDTRARGALLVALAVLASAPAAFAGIQTTGVVFPASPSPSQEFKVGYLANGSLVVDGGYVLTTGSGYVGYGDGISIVPTASATITGSGSAWNSTSGISIGSYGIGTLLLQQGGQINSNGAYVGSGSSALIDGVGSAWNNTDSYSMMTINGQFTLQNGGVAGVNTCQSDGTMAVSGTGSTFSAHYLDIGLYASGSFSLQNGAQLVADLTSMAYFPGTTGQITISGKDTHWESTNGGAYIHVGLDGAGTMSILSGATVTTLGLAVGDGNQGTGSGTLLVDGSGSRLDIVNYLNIGASAGGSMTISNGAVVTTGNTTYVGDAYNFTGSGVRSLLTIDNATHTAHFLAVGAYVPGDLVVTDGANVAITGNAYIGSTNATVSGCTVLVQGSNSVLTCAQMLTVGGGSAPGGSATLTVKDGGTAVVTGAAKFMFIWPAGIVNLQGGAISAPTIMNFGTLTGSGSVTGAFSNQNFLSIGNSVGALSVTGTFTQADAGYLRVEVASDSSFDTLTVSGASTLGGVVDIVFLYTPVGPHTYHFLDAPSITSTASYTVTGLDPALVTTSFSEGNFSVNVPEPAGLPVLAAGALALLRRRRRT